MKTKLSLATLKTVVLFVILSTTLSCSSSEPGKPITTITIGVLPDQKKEILVRQYQPLLDYLHTKTGLAFKLVIPTSYHDFLNLFKGKKLDLANFGGTSYVRAQKAVGAVPLVLRGKDLKFTSSFIVRSENHFSKISDFKNKSFAFGAKLSTSGHIMPRFFMKKENIIPETFFSNVEYSGKHDLTAKWVQDGRADIGVANSTVIKNMLADGRLKGEVRILWQTPPFSDYVWAVQKTMNDSTQIKIRDAFLALSLNIPQHKIILDSLNAEYYLPAGINDFSNVSDAVEDYELFFN